MPPPHGGGISNENICFWRQLWSLPGSADIGQCELSAILVLPSKRIKLFVNLKVLRVLGSSYFHSFDWKRNPFLDRIKKPENFRHICKKVREKYTGILQENPLRIPQRQRQIFQFSIPRRRSLSVRPVLFISEPIPSHPNPPPRHRDPWGGNPPTYRTPGGGAVRNDLVCGSGGGGL